MKGREGGLRQGTHLSLKSKILNCPVPQFPLHIMGIIVPFHLNVEDQISQHTEYCWMHVSCYYFHTLAVPQSLETAQ